MKDGYGIVIDVFNSIMNTRTMINVSTIKSPEMENVAIALQKNWKQERLVIYIVGRYRIYASELRRSYREES